MRSNKFSAQIERFEVVETGRRRRWTDDEKLKIVLESLQAPHAVSSTARRYGISRSLRLTADDIACLKRLHPEVYPYLPAAWLHALVCPDNN